MTGNPPISRRHLAAAAIIFLVVLLASLGAAAALWQSARERDEARFEAEVELAVTALANRMETHVALLRGTAGFFAASDEVTLRDFDAYVSRLGIGSRYPGVLGIGYSGRVQSEEEKAELVARMRREGFSDFRIWPDDARETYHSILYLFPLDRRNRAAIGYDMTSEPRRRMAMEMARDRGRSAVTAKVLLVQEIDPAKQPGFLVYLPIYRGGGIPGTIAERRRLLQGFAYSPLRAHDLLGTVFSSGAKRQVDVAIYNGEAEPDNLIYRTAPAFRDTFFTAERSMEIAGRPWSLKIAAAPAFAADSSVRYAYWAAGLGTFIALLLAAAAIVQGRAATATERARLAQRDLNATLERRVEERTAELAAANQGLTDEMGRREAAEAQVRQMQKMEAVGQLTGGIAHDFNNMLAIVIGSLDMAKRRLSEPRRLTRLIDNALEGANRAAALTQRLLAFSRRQPLNPAPIDANELVSGMHELLERTLGETIHLEMALADRLWHVFADGPQLENTILNLAVNARDAMPEGGTLTIETSNRRLPKEHEGNHAQVEVGQYVVVAVTDTGIGMSPDIVAQAFDPFFTTKDVGKGTGLGLSQVFGFVKQSGGHVSIRSKEGLGTTIEIFLPRHFGAEGQPAKKEAVPPPLSPTGTPDEVILVVEDEDRVRMMSVEALRELGYSVLNAPSGPEALRILDTNPAVDLLFTDVVMPEMNGRELADEAVQRRPGLKLLFTTGYTRNAVAQDGIMDPEITYLLKPFTIDQLAAKIRAVLDDRERLPMHKEPG